jgi:hypothetical protein
MSNYRAGSFVCCAGGCDRPKGHISHPTLHQCWFRGRTGGMGFYEPTPEAAMAAFAKSWLR